MIFIVCIGLCPDYVGKVVSIYENAFIHKTVWFVYIKNRFIITYAFPIQAIIAKKTRGNLSQTLCASWHHTINRGETTTVDD